MPMAAFFAMTNAKGENCFAVIFKRGNLVRAVWINSCTEFSGYSERFTLLDSASRQDTPPIPETGVLAAVLVALDFFF